MAQEGEITVRRATVDDVDLVHGFMTKSTGGKALMSKSQLRRELSEIYELDDSSEAIRNPDPQINIDLALVKPNTPVCHARLAELAGVAVGYVTFHYFYSPWRGRILYVEDIFVDEAQRRQGVAKKLLENLADLCKREGLLYLVFRADALRSELKPFLQKHRPVVMRNDDSDWSVYRVDF